MKSMLLNTQWIVRRLASVIPQRLVPLEFRLNRTSRTSQRKVPIHIYDNIKGTLGLSNDSTTRLVTEYLNFMNRIALHRSLATRIHSQPRWLTVTGIEHLDTALTEGRGALLVSAHVGHPRLIPNALAAHGRRARLVRVMTRVASERRQRLEEYAEKSPVLHFFKKNLIGDPIDDINADLDVRPILTTLSHNKAVVILGDGLRSTEFVMSELLGRPYPFPTGLLKIATVTGAPILPVFAIESHSCFHLDVAIEPALNCDLSAPPADNIEKLAIRISRQLRLVPQQYHRWNIPNLFESLIQWVESEERWTTPYDKWWRRTSEATTR